MVSRTLLLTEKMELPAEQPADHSDFETEYVTPGNLNGSRDFAETILVNFTNFIYN